MAVSTLPAHHQKRPKIVYGKNTSTSRYGAFSHLDDDEPRGPQLPPAKKKSTALTQETGSKPHTLKRPRSYAKASADAFDVPSSNEEEEEVVLKRASPIEFVSRKALVKDSSPQAKKLAPWEKRAEKNERASQNGGLSTRHREDEASAQLLGEMRRAEEWPQIPQKGDSVARAPKPVTKRAQVVLGDANQTEHRVKPSKTNDTVAKAEPARVTKKRRAQDDDVDVFPGPSPSSAAAKLSARRAGLPSSSLSAVQTNEDGTRAKQKRHLAPSNEHQTSHKRAKITKVGNEDDDVSMENGGSTQGESGTLDVFDIPDSDHEVDLPSKSARKSPKPVKQAVRRRKAVATTHSRAAAQPSSSAPARLHEMVPTDSESPEAPTRSPSPTASRVATPKTAATPPDDLIDQPETAFKAPATLTPRQARLWQSILPDKTSTESPSTLPMKDLEITGQRKSSHPTTVRTLTKSKSDVGRRRNRLVDRLKASAPTSAEEADDDDDDHEAEGTLRKSQPKRSNDQSSQDQPQHESPTNSTTASQARSQPKTKPGAGPKITYASTRSFLPEDSLEDALMLDLVPDIPKPAKPAHSFTAKTKAAPTSQKTDFDLDDSDDEAGAGRFRTIHELRASGRNNSTMEDIEGLIRDIQNHNQSNRSRRRSAMIELASKLTDKTFIERFTAHSFELQLVLECAASPDNITDFALAGALLSLFAADLSEHSTLALGETGVMAWLTKMLVLDRDIVKVARERASNMSKVSQASLAELVKMVTAQAHVWDGVDVPPLTPRIVALKGLEQLVRKLRRSGNKEQLLSPEQVALVLSSSDASALQPDESAELEMAISLLELLSTSSTPSKWPAELVSRIAEMIPHMTSSSPRPRHILFLTLRLCLNLTNVDIGNCEPLSTPPVIAFLLQTVKEGFTTLDTQEINSTSEVDAEASKLALDLLVLAMGCTINLAEHNDSARAHARQDPDLLTATVRIFLRGKQRMLEAESEEQGISNVAFGYLAVMLANLCQNAETRGFIAGRLPGKSLGALVEAVQEFVSYHQKVDNSMDFEGNEGGEVWGAFTEKLRAVLERLRSVSE